MAHHHVSSPRQHFAWGKVIWANFLPPTCSCILWKLIYHKFPVDDNLISRGVIVVSMCSLCVTAMQNSVHYKNKVFGFQHFISLIILTVALSSSSMIGAFLGGSIVFLGMQDALYVKLPTTIWVIEYAFDVGWHNLWLECDSKPMLATFQNILIVP
uniref:Reverse transcriptase zinc-binding domain-containing protein n=1 Tax=Cajanus cajan TaxID=3821 RepID=A0A151SME7_CAJCA|nr:hypothetical protein KK1_002232 [Cajanus cajan]